ncbi:MAG: hypothetical protein GYB49_09405 [Alphaproteobacteria bacterium]|nr:hypothetical protein [Hyphomonas sp.]MBR9807425.1 hypothetical protein [Alphaproteobacteria bacterium]
MILAIDPSVSRTGWCKGHPGGPVQTGSLGLGSFGKELGPTLNALEQWLEGALDGVDIVFYEQPIQFGKQSFDSRRKLYALGSLIELVCYRRRIQVREVNNQTCKALCYGSAKMKSAEVKERGVGLAKAWGFEPANHDQADACAVFLVGTKLWFPEDFKTWVDRKAANARKTGELLL